MRVIMIKTEKIKMFITAVALSTLLAGIAYAGNINIQADKQVYNGDTGVTRFEGNVKVTSDDVTVTSPVASVKMTGDNKAQDAVFLDGAYAVKQKGNTKNEIKANIIRFSLLENKVIAEGNTKSWVFEGKKPMIIIEADTQEFDTVNNIMTADGGVTIDYNDLKTRSYKAKIAFDKASGKVQKVDLMGAANLVQGKSIVDADSFVYNPVNDELIAIGNTHSQSVLDDASKVSIWSNYQHFDKKSGTLMTNGNVKIIYKDYVGTGPKATFLPEKGSTKPNKILF